MSPQLLRSASTESAKLPAKIASTKRAMLLLTALCASSIWLSLSATSASAALTYVSAGTIPVAEFTPAHSSALYAESVAVDDHNGHIYVADSDSGEILDYSSASDASPELWTGSNTPDGSFGGGKVSVAVDNSTGDVYVADPNNRVIDKFDQNGNLITSFGDTSPSPNGQLAGAGTPAGSFNPDLGYYFGSWAIGIDQATHDLYVVDGGNEAIGVFDENGTYLRNITAAPEGLYGREFGEVDTNGIAVNASTGDLYVANYTQFGPGVYEFDSAGNYVSTWNGGALPNGAASETPNGNFGNFYALTSLATEDTTGQVFVYSQEHAAIDVYDPSGNFIAPQVNAGIPGGQGIAIDQANGDIYLSEGYLSNGGAIQIYKPLIVPDITVGSVSNLTASSATFNGHLDPAGGGEISECYFEYGTSRSYGSKAPCAEGQSFSEPVDVHADVTGLSPGTEYYYRLVAANENGRNSVAGLTFPTVGLYRLSADTGSTGSGDGQLVEPHSVALDESSGDIYVADTGNHRIVKFDPSGHFLAAWGWGVSDGNAASEVCTSSCQAGIAGPGSGQFSAPTFIAVDNSNSPSAGDLYVADTTNDVVQKFDSTGHLVTPWEANGARAYPERIEGVAVESNGNLVVRTGGGNGIAVDSFGNVLGGPIAVDLATNDRYVDNGEVIHVLRADEELFEAFGFGNLHSAEDLVFDQSNRALYVANTGENDIAIFRPAATPEVTTGPASTVEADSATVTGHVDPASAGSVSDCYFEYGTNSTYGLGKLPCSPSTSLSSPTEVTATLTGLTPYASYHYRLVAVSSDGAGLPTFGRDRTVTPVSGVTPSIESSEASAVTPTAATITTDINPHLASTIYRIRYGTSAAYGAQTPPSNSIGEDGVGHQVSTEISELRPATTYHFRVLAVNFNGSTAGSDGTFTTPDVPSVVESGVSAAGKTAATLTAALRPGFRSTTYHFEYGLTADYSGRTAESSSIGSDNSTHTVSATLSGLAPGTTYHYRAVASNAIGSTDGPDQTFTTQESAMSKEEPSPVQCKHGFVLRHGRCVKKHQRSKRHHHV
jgi:DNA-binding beta-propeller fold protein YncE